MNKAAKANKLVSMQEAIATYVADNYSVTIEGFTAFICFAAGHEIIRQRRRNLTLIRMTPDLIYDQMIAAGVASKLVFSYMGNPGVGSLYCIRRAVEKAIPRSLELEEYSHYGLVGRYAAGASRLPFFPLRSYVGSDMLVVNPLIKLIDDPYGTGKIAVVPPLNPDVAILHAQRADRQGNTQLWGLLGMQKEVAFAAQHVIVVVEEVIDEAMIRVDPNRTLIPGLLPLWAGLAWGIGHHPLPSRRWSAMAAVSSRRARVCSPCRSHARAAAGTAPSSRSRARSARARVASDARGATRSRFRRASRTAPGFG